MGKTGLKEGFIWKVDPTFSNPASSLSHCRFVFTC